MCINALVLYHILLFFINSDMDSNSFRFIIFWIENNVFLACRSSTKRSTIFVSTLTSAVQG